MNVFAVALSFLIWTTICVYGMRQSYSKNRKVLLTIWVLLYAIISGYIVLALFG